MSYKRNWSFHWSTGDLHCSRPVALMNVPILRQENRLLESQYIYYVPRWIFRISLCLTRVQMCSYFKPQRFKFPWVIWSWLGPWWIHCHDSTAKQIYQRCCRPLCEMCGLSSAALQCLEEAEPTACPSCMWLENGLMPGKCYRGNAERSHRFPIQKVYHSPNSPMYHKKWNWFEVQKTIQIYPTTSRATEDTKPAWEEVWLKIFASSPDCASGARDTPSGCSHCDVC